MKWFIAAALVIGVLILVFMPVSKHTNTDVDAMMKRVRAAKAKKARERKDKISYTPPAKHEGGIMKVA